jgi:translation initiation factor IF-3
MELIGTIKVIGETATFGAKGFRKREVVITTEEQYPQSILVEFVQDKCDLLDKFQVGKNVKIGINLRGREWVNTQGETKYFNSIQGWNINSFITEGDKDKMHAPLMTEAQKEDNDLPF